MTRIYSKLISAAFILFSSLGFAQSDLIITGVLDADLPMGLPKAIEIYVINDVADLSIYGLGSANNGGGTDGEEYTFPAEAALAGDFLYIASEAPMFNAYFGFDADYVNGNAAGINGDDAVELFMNGSAVDVFGEIDVDGSGMPWEYADSWAYRNDGATASSTFTLSNWNIPGPNVLDGATTNGGSSNPWPLGTYSTEGGSSETVTIAQIQTAVDPDGDSPLTGDDVTTSGVVTGKYGSGFWIQDGVGEWSGLFIRQDDATVAVGDSVTVTGTVQENFGLTRLTNITEIVVNSFLNVLPAATTVTTAMGGTEAYESVLLEVLAVTCINDNLGFGEWLIDDGSGTYRVDDVMYDADPILFAGYDLVGIATYSFDNFKLLPRDADDVMLNANADELGIYFETGMLIVSEEDGTITVSVGISNPTTVATTVNVVVAGGTAVNGTDYNFTNPTTLTFPANDGGFQTFTFDIIDDAVANEDRTITFELQNANNSAVFGTSQLDVTIQDNDGVVEITDIDIVAEVDAVGVAVNLGNEFTVGGVVYGVNNNGDGLQFTIIDPTGGIGLFTDNAFDYTVTEGDSVVVTGTVGQFNGLTQLSPSAITLISQGNDLMEPLVVTELSEISESNLVKLECVFVTNPGEWDGMGSGFNVIVSNGTAEFTVRIDNDVDLYSMMPPTGTFDLVGIGGQYDIMSPFFDGYQLLPRSSADIQATDCTVEQPPSNDNCTDAADVNALLGGEIGVAQNSTLYTNVGASVGAGEPAFGYECFGEPDGSGSAPSVEHTVWFEFIGDGNTYFIETNNCAGTATDYIPAGDTQIAIYSGICAIATAEACNEDGPNSTATEYPAGLVFATLTGQSYLLMVDGYDNAVGEFCLSFTRLPVANDDCAGAIDLTSLTGGELNIPQVSTVYSNIGATSENDPDVNADMQCWFGDPLTGQTAWFTFMGDGNTYFLETADCAGTAAYADDTQIAIYTGACNDLVQIDCNEDISAANFAAGIQISTVAGTEYTVLIDSYNDLAGDFCIQMTNSDPDGISENNSFSFDVYPNPSSDRLFVEAPKAVESATLSNVLGQLSREFQFSASERVELSVAGLQPGVYILQLSSGNEFATSKVVVE